MASVDIDIPIDVSASGKFGFHNSDTDVLAAALAGTEITINLKPRLTTSTEDPSRKHT